MVQSKIAVCWNCAKRIIVPKSTKITYKYLITTNQNKPLPKPVTMLTYKHEELEYLTNKSLQHAIGHD